MNKISVAKLITNKQHTLKNATLQLKTIKYFDFFCNVADKNMMLIVSLL